MPVRQENYRRRNVYLGFIPRVYISSCVVVAQEPLVPLQPHLSLLHLIIESLLRQSNRLSLRAICESLTLSAIGDVKGLYTFLLTPSS